MSYYFSRILFYCFACFLLLLGRSVVLYELCSFISVWVNIFERLGGSARIRHDFEEKVLHFTCTKCAAMIEECPYGHIATYISVMAFMCFEYSVGFCQTPVMGFQGVAMHDSTTILAEWDKKKTVHKTKVFVIAQKRGVARLKTLLHDLCNFTFV